MFQISFPEYTIHTLAVKLKPSAERLLLKSEHPWIFDHSIDKINKKGNAGDIAIVFRQKSNKILGVGLYDPDSPIIIKMLHYYSGLTIDQSFFKDRLEQAKRQRSSLVNSKTNSYRLLYGENDGLPGCIVDVYNQVAVVKLYSAIWFPYLKTIVECLSEVISCQAVVLRLSRNLQTSSSASFCDGQVIWGELKQEVVHFLEHGVHFSAHVIKGHKTGYFLDHRENRRRVGELSKGRTVLDVFAYAGGFSVHALVGGARFVTSVDISEQALELAKENATLNEFQGEHKTIAGDAFEILNQFQKEHKKFDIVIIDPPSFAKSAAETELALKKYQLLARMGAAITADNGYLILASCSSRVSSEDFFKTIDQELKKQKTNFQLIDKTFHDIDHPVKFKEGEYLKCAYYHRLKRK